MTYKTHESNSSSESVERLAKRRSPQVAESSGGRPIPTKNASWRAPLNKNHDGRSATMMIRANSDPLLLSDSNKPSSKSSSKSNKSKSNYNGKSKQQQRPHMEMEIPRHSSDRRLGRKPTSYNTNGSDGLFLVKANDQTELLQQTEKHTTTKLKSFLSRETLIRPKVKS